MALYGDGRGEPAQIPKKTRRATGSETGPVEFGRGD